MRWMMLVCNPVANTSLKQFIIHVHVGFDLYHRILFACGMRFNFQHVLEELEQLTKDNKFSQASKATNHCMHWYQQLTMRMRYSLLSSLTWSLRFILLLGISYYHPSYVFFFSTLYRSYLVDSDFVDLVRPVERFDLI